MMFLNWIKAWRRNSLLLIFCLVLILAIGGTVQAQEGAPVPNYVASVSWSPDGTRIAVSRGPLGRCDLESEEYVVDIVSMATNEVLDQIPIATRCVAPSVAWNVDGSRLVITGSEGRPSMIWNMVLSPSLVTESHDAAGADAVDLWSPDGIRVARVSQDLDTVIWDIRRGETQTTCCNSAAGDAPIAVGWSPGTANIVAGYEGGGVAIWDSRDFRQLRELEGHRADVRAVAFNRDGSKIATADWDGVIQIWDGLTGENLMQLQVPEHTRIRVVAWNPVGDQVVTAGDDGFVYVWDTVSGEVIDSIQSTGPIYDVDWSPDGTRLIYGGESADGEGVYDIVLSPVPARCDTTVEAGDTDALVSAVIAANNAPLTMVVCLTNSTYVFNPENITRLYDEDGFNAFPTLGKVVIINGNGAVLERFSDSEFDFRFFHVSTPGTLILNNVVLSGGAATIEEDGGAILNKGMLTVIDTQFLNNRAESGGAISNSGVIVTSVNSDFTGNTAVIDNGGAIANEGGVLDIVNTSFFNNTASNQGGAIDDDPGTVKIERGFFSFNTAGDDGGAIYVSNGTLTIMESVFHFNTSRDDGGAMHIDDTATAYITMSTFSRNRAADNGGAISNDGFLEASDNCFENNTASDYSAVAGIQEGTVIINNWWGTTTGPVPADEDNNGGVIEFEVNYEPYIETMPVFCELPQ